MTKTKILRSIMLPRQKVVGLTQINNKVWFATSSRNRIYHGAIGTDDKFRATEYSTSKIANPTGFAWNGKNLYLADRKEKKIFSSDIHMKKMKLSLSLKEIKPSNIPMVFLVPSAEITDVAWGNGLLWFTCKAGYSSSFYGVDIEKKTVVYHARTRGADPEGISFDSQQKHLWVLDSGNLELSQFTSKGSWTGHMLPVLLEKPTGLIIDYKDTFWITDLKTRKLYQLKEEDN